MRVVLLLLIFFGSSTAALCQEYGQFVGNPDGSFISDPDRPQFKLNRPFVYRDPNGLEWTVPAGEVTDGASIPRFAWSLVGGPFDGPYLDAAIIHDYYCCTKSREYYSTHHAFWMGMRAAGVSDTMAYIMWSAVRFGGPAFWSVDPSAVAPVPCRTDNVAAKSLYEMSDERTRAIAIGKFAGMARTLKTSGGKVLDVVDGKAILAQTDEAERHLDFLRGAMAKNFNVEQDKLGLFSMVSEEELKGYEKYAVPLSPWAEGQIPALDTYMKTEKLTFPKALQLNGADYRPYVTNDAFKLQTTDFPDKLLKDGTKE
ncbi:DUF1353 domain-containing protein [Mesorhizobium sp. B3-1-9]|uniref:DUF1353 domain-containing protein n=1 Tax=Mesorhizobium sp. B3-1-9 TaxID=2589892 RepID=UPI00112BFBDB|nr:DUF1353 domain-containing protein [Mesorhizobium sp. B3-1-9]TPI27329.1 DUF1353 domain-containing protein [Mesorhizobium sp. B3-1-9]